MHSSICVCLKSTHDTILNTERISLTHYWLWYSLNEEISPEYLLKGLMLKLKLQYFGHLMWRTDSLEKTLMLGKIEGRKGERDGRGWDGWMASSTQWTWVWVSSGSWWWTGGPVWSMALQRVRHDWATELNWLTEWGELKKLTIPCLGTSIFKEFTQICIWIRILSLSLDMTGRSGSCRWLMSGSTCSYHLQSSCQGLEPSAAAAAKSLQSCPTLCDPIDGSPPGSSIHGIFQARVLEWGAFSRVIKSFQKFHVS